MMTRTALMAALSASLFTGCVVASTDPVAPAAARAPAVRALQPAPASDEKLYTAAIIDVGVATPAKQLVLKPIPNSDPVHVVTLTSPYDPLACTEGSSCTLKRPATTRGDTWTWVTIEPEVKDRCARVFVVLTVRPSALRRPCLGTGERDGQPICTLTWPRGVAAEDATRANRFAAEQMAAAYYFDVTTDPSRPEWGFPYTRLGYTYDWAPDAQPNHYGASEFVVPASTAITVVNRMTAAEYCRK